MKKIILLTLAFARFAFGAEGDATTTIQAVSVLAAVIGLGIAALGGAIGMGHATAATILGIARNPGLGSKLMNTMFIAVAMIEAQVIYTFVLAVIALYGNPFL